MEHLVGIRACLGSTGPRVFNQIFIYWTHIPGTTLVLSKLLKKNQLKVKYSNFLCDFILFFDHLKLFSGAPVDYIAFIRELAILQEYL